MQKTGKSISGRKTSLIYLRNGEEANVTSNVFHSPEAYALIIIKFSQFLGMHCYLHDTSFTFFYFINYYIFIL